MDGETEETEGTYVKEGQRDGRGLDKGGLERREGRREGRDGETRGT